MLFTFIPRAIYFVSINLLLLNISTTIYLHFIHSLKMQINKEGKILNCGFMFHYLIIMIRKIQIFFNLVMKFDIFKILSL